MKEQHTPGPWRVTEDNTQHRPFFIVRPENSGTPIAEVYSSGDANARLIAAAPDLLAALRWLLDIAERAQRNAPECETLEAGYVQQICCGAIAKIEGKQLVATAVAA
jgi:hypothetical protein